MGQTAKTLPPNSLNSEIYSLSKKFYLKLFISSFLLLLVIIMITIPLNTIIEKQIALALAQNPKCKISYQKMSISYFLPTIKLQNITIPRYCLNDRTQNFKRLDLKLIRPSFFPLGAKVDIKIYDGAHPILLETILGLSKKVIVINQPKVPAAFINNFLPLQYQLAGTLSIKANFSLAGKKDIKGAFLIKSNNFRLPSTNISGLELPDLNFQKLYIKASINKRKVLLKSVELGNANSPIKLLLKGDALLNFVAFNYTRLNLEGSLNFSKEFAEAFPLINMLLSGKKKKNGQYFFSIKGTIKSPRPTF